MTKVAVDAGVAATDAAGVAIDPDIPITEASQVGEGREREEEEKERMREKERERE